MGWPADLTWYKLLTDWGSVIGGSLALARRRGDCLGHHEIGEPRDSGSARATKVAQRQTAVTREIERRRIAREGYAFYAMLEAAMAAVIEDVGAAQNLPPPSATSRNRYSAEAYTVRQCVKRVGFTELRDRFSSLRRAAVPAQFLQIDKEIEDFAGQWIAPVTSASGFSIPMRVNAGLEEQLERIEQHATALREKAAGGNEAVPAMSWPKNWSTLSPEPDRVETAPTMGLLL